MPKIDEYMVHHARLLRLSLLLKNVNEIDELVKGCGVWFTFSKNMNLPDMEAVRAGSPTKMPDSPPKQKYAALTRREHLSLADIAYNALLGAIVNQDFEPGAQLSIDGLAKQLAMSNTPVREALMRANGERLVQQKTNHGFVVAPFLTVAELRQMFDVRYILETHALDQAQLPNTSVNELGRLGEQMDRVSDGAVYSDFKDYLLLDHEFHRTLIGLSGNSFLVKAWQDLHVHLHLARLYTGVGLFDRSESASEHLEIIDALKSDELENARHLLASHIRRVEERVSKFLDEHAPRG